MIKALIFDCFGVFYTDPVFAYMREPTTPAAKAEALHALDDQAARGLLNKRGFVAKSAQLLAISPEEAEQRFFHSSDRNDRLVTLVQDLRKPYKVAMLSNIGGDMMDGFFAPEERNKLFDAVILSGDVNLAKPEREIFQLTCDRLGVDLDEALMIDDMRSTCNAVKAYGMKSICYQSFEQLKVELDALLV